MTLLQLSSAAPHAVEISRPKVAVIGAGHWGKNIVRNFAALKALAAVVDQDRLTAQTLCATHGGAAASFEDVLADVSITAVAVATPAVLHHHIAKAALEAGKHVFVEKPLALALEQAEELVALPSISIAG